MLKKCIVLCGGGTGGHIYPNLALESELSPYRRICYIGNKGGMEERLCKEKEIEFFGISAPKFKRKIAMSNLKLPFALKRSVEEAKKILKELAPTVIFSKGGYVSLPVCLAGLSLKIPVLCHESDLTIGLANKIAYKKGGTLLTAFSKTAEGKKRAIHTGAPLRRELFKNKTSLKQSVKINGDTRSTLLVIGGSQGAKGINEAVVSNLCELTQKFKIIHVAGMGKVVSNAEIGKQLSHLTAKQLEELLLSYTQIEYASDMGELYKSADIAISRGGANALFELLEWEIPTLVIPLEKGSRGDQVENAEYFSQKKLCHTLSENHIFGFCESIFALEKNKNTIKQNIQTAKRESVFDGRANIAKLILSHK